MENKYMVRTYCRTYNHEKYILDALDGFAMQQTDFPVVTTIVEDCSTDNTAGVIRKYLNDYFALNDTMVAYEKETDYAIIVFSQHKTNKNCFFAVLFLKYNHWRLKKSVFPYIEEWSNNSKYYAICEGDDYWIDPKKLQIQVGFMENNPEYGLVYSMAKVYDTMTNTFSNNLMGKETTSFESLFFANDIPTATTCFKAELFNQYLNEESCWDTKGWMMGDYPKWLWMSKNSGIHFFRDIFSVYRIVEGSATHNKDITKKEGFIRGATRIRTFFADKYGIESETREKIPVIEARGFAYLYAKEGLLKKLVPFLYKLGFKEAVYVFLYGVKNFFLRCLSLLCKKA